MKPTKEYWEGRIKYYSEKYGENSIEVESARLNLMQVLALARGEEGEK